MLRRYVDQDLFRTLVGPIFQLKSNSWAPPPGEPWYVQWNVFAYAHPGKITVWETRTVDNVLADITTVKATTRATGNPEDASKGPAFFKSISAEATYKWDLVRGRLTSAARTETISSRFTRADHLYDSDLIVKSTLAPASPVPAKTPEPIKPTAQPEVKPAAGDGKTTP